MTSLSKFQLDQLEHFNINDQDRDEVIFILETVKIDLDASGPGHTLRHTQMQIGYLVSLMDMERDDRLSVLALILGWEPSWSHEPFPGEAHSEKTAHLYPGPSSKDVDITKYMHGVLITFYQDGDGLRLNELLGLDSRSAGIRARRAAREAAKQIQTSFPI